MPRKSRLNPQSALKTNGALLDDTNRQLLQLLHEDPRLSMSELARRVGKSAPAVSERIQRLEAAGVIAG